MALSANKLSDSMCDFSLDMYQHLAWSPDSANVFLSPSSIMAVLAMLYVGARNNTEKQMAEVLKLKGLNQISVLTYMEKFVSTLKEGNQSVTLNTANKLYPHSNKIILEEYLSLVKRYFHADLKSMNYSTNAEGARLEINKWVEEVTNSKIQNLLPENSLNALTAMVVVNAIYFKGNWATQFKPADTRKMPFNLLTSAVKEVNMMHREMKKVRFGENEELSCKVLELPYVGKEIAMIIVLPNDNNGLPALEKKMSLKVLRSLTNDIYPDTVQVSLPKFKVESSYELSEALSVLGMSDIFDAEKSDLSGMGNNLHVSTVVHKAFVDVNEEGTEAAAATAVVILLMGRPFSNRFVADHPFLFMIWDHRLDVPLFIGRLTDPPAADENTQTNKDEL